MKAPWIFIALALGLIFACGEQVNSAAPPPAASAPPPAKPAGAASTAASASIGAAPSGSAALHIVDGDFIEGDTNRDPFRAFVAVSPSSSVKMPVSAVTILPVILKNYSIEELKLVAIIQAGDYPRALFIDPTGQDYILRRGMLLGKPEIMHPPNTTQSYPLYWKIDSIKPAEVVLIREDPTHPESVPTYREVLLHLASEGT